LVQDGVIDYSRQGRINRAFAVLLAVSIILGTLVFYYNLITPAYQFVYIAAPIVLLLLSLGMGVASKRAIDYIPGEWEKRKTFVTFTEYERMIDEYEDAYGDLVAHPGDVMTCCCMLPVLAAIGYLTVTFQQSGSTILIHPLIDTLILTAIYYSVVGAAGFIVGFRIPAIDADEFFTSPMKSGDVFDFASELEGVPGIKAGMNVELGIREGIQTILDAEIKAGVEGLPDTVKVGVQVSHSGFAYPYLVGTVYKGANIPSKHSEHYRLRTRYPALLEFSMDEDVAVIVARFDIPKRTSDVPSISRNDFRAIAQLLAQELKKNYEASPQA
jgi:hypothetical protein